MTAAEVAIVDDPVWAPFLERPERSGIFSDFDGTLAPIVDDPGDARALPGSSDALAALAARMGRVGVLSGRPVSFLEPMFSPDVLLVGLYGLECSQGGERHDHPLGGAWREVIDDVAATARGALPDGVLVEPKGLSLTLHYRQAPEAEDVVARFAERQAVRSGLHSRPAKKSIELHPPIAVDKGSALLDHAEGLAAVCFIGDDEGDLTAFDALDRLATTEVHTVRVAVTSDEASPELLGRADVALDGPPAVRDLLRHLLDPTGPSAP